MAVGEELRQRAFLFSKLNDFFIEFLINRKSRRYATQKSAHEGIYHTIKYSICLLVESANEIMSRKEKVMILYEHFRGNAHMGK